MIGITELLIVIGVFALVGLYLATVRYLFHRQEEPPAVRRSVPSRTKVAAPDRGATVSPGHNDVLVPTR